MANLFKAKILDELRARFGEIRKIEGSNSLFVIGHDAARIYFRYSKIHPGGRTFFGLRETDLRQLEGHNSHICFLSDERLPPVFIPYSDFEEVFHLAEPALDGQYKVQLFNQSKTLELYIPKQGRFNVEAYVGIEALDRSMDAKRLSEGRDFSHSQVQTLLAAIGHVKGYQVYVPENDFTRLDLTLTKEFPLRRVLPEAFEQMRPFLSEIDVVWLSTGRNKIEGLYEVEHSTPIYSGLLRFNDVLLTVPEVQRFSIVSNDSRRDLFSRQLLRPTFRKSGLADLCSFMEYANVFEWHQRLLGGQQ
jgi:hypothetical protein